MAEFKFTKTEIDGVFIIEPTCFGDDRGYFVETYNQAEFLKNGIDAVFVQDNQSKSCKGVLRGLHLQKSRPQAKLVRVISGEVFDVAVDVRPGSKTYGKWAGVTLSAENKKQFFVPRGLAHGFLVVSDEAEFAYKCDDFYCPGDEAGILWNDKTLNINWPLADGIIPKLSDKDTKLPDFKAFTEAL